VKYLEKLKVAFYESESFITKFTTCRQATTLGEENAINAVEAASLN
jgi:hypothetical protein